MFPAPFGENLPPGLDGVVDSIALDSETIQEIANRLTIAVREDVSRDKTAVARLKTKLVKGITTDMKMDRADTLTPIARRFRQAAEISLADDDAEIMRIAPRLNSYLPAEAIPTGATGFPSPGAPGGPDTPQAQPPVGSSFAVPWTPPTPPGARPLPVDTGHQWGCNASGLWSYPASAYAPGPPPDPVANPAGYPQAQGNGVWLWVQNPGRLPTVFAPCGPGTGEGGGGGGGPPAPPICPPVPICPPPRPCEPCPVGIPPGETLPAVPWCPVGVPAAVVQQATYAVPWLHYAGQPSVYSECGRKMVNDAAGDRDPAQALVNALASPQWATIYLGSGRERVPFALARESFDYDSQYLQ